MKKDILNSYMEYVIKPIEEKRNSLQKEIDKGSILTKKKRQQYLDKYDDLLFEKYKNLEKLMSDDTLNNKWIIEKKLF